MEHIGMALAGGLKKTGGKSMTLNLSMPGQDDLKPRITVFGVGGAGGNAVNNMIEKELDGVEFVVANTDAQALQQNQATSRVQLGVKVTEGLGAGARASVGAAAAEESIEQIVDHLAGAHMCFITAGMGGGTGTGAAPIIAQAARELGVLTVGVVTKPFQFEGNKRMKQAEEGVEALQKVVDTLIIIPNQNLFRLANEKTTFTEAFSMADDVLYQGVKGVTDLMVRPGLINLDFADVRSVMRGMGKAMMGTGEATGDNRAQQAAEAAIANPLLDESSMKGARGLLISITGGNDLTLFEVDEAATRIREEVDADANIILGATFDESLDGVIRVSVVATGIDREGDAAMMTPPLPTSQPVAKPAIETTKPAAPAPAPAQAAAPTNAERAREVAARAVASLEQELAIPQQSVSAASDPEVQIKPFKPSAADMMGAKSPMMDIEDETPVAKAETAAESKPYIPPAAETHTPAPRMPRVEDFPPIAQREILSQQTAAPAAQTAQAAPAAAQPAAHEDHHHGEHDRPMGLLRRLAGGLGRREDEEDEMLSAPSQVPAQAARPAPQAAPRPAQRPVNHGAAGQLDGTGRAAPKPMTSAEDEQLEIPAFLRRQAN